MKVGAKFNQAQWNAIYKNNQLNQLAEFINRNKNYLIYPFELRLGAIRATNTGYKPTNNFADSFTSVSQIFDGKSSPLAKWEGAYVVDQPEELLGDWELELPPGDHSNVEIHKKSGSARKGYKVGRFVEVMFESERLGTSFSPTPDNNFVQQKYAKTYTMFSTEELATDDYLKLWIIPDLLPNKFSNEKAPANMADPQFLYIVNNEIYRDPDTGKFAYSRITFASVQDQIATTGMAQWQFVQLAAPGSGYAFPSVNLTDDGSYERDKYGKPIVNLNPVYARNVGVRYMSVEANAPIGTNTIFAVGRPKPVENRTEEPYQDWEQEQYEWEYDAEGYVKVDGDNKPIKKMLGVYKKVQHNQDIWPSRHLFYWRLGAPILDYLTTRTNPTSELAFIDNVSLDMSKWGEWKNYFKTQYDPATKWNFGGGVDIKDSDSFEAESGKITRTLKKDTIFAPDTDKPTMIVYDFQARVNIDEDHVSSTYDQRQLGYTNIIGLNGGNEHIGSHEELEIRKLPNIRSGYGEASGARVPDVLVFNAFALANTIELPIDKNSFLTMNYSSLPGISRLLNLLYFIPGIGQIVGVIGGALNDIASGVNPGWRISGAPYQTSPMLKSFNFFAPHKTTDLMAFRDTSGEGEAGTTWLPLNMFDDNSPQNMNNLFNFKSVAVQWMGQLSDRLKISQYNATTNDFAPNQAMSSVALGQTLDGEKSYQLFDPNNTTQSVVSMPDGSIYDLGIMLPPEQVDLNDGNGSADQSYIIDYLMVKALGQCDYRVKFYADDPNKPYADPDELCVWVGTYSSASKFYNQPSLWTSQIRLGFEEQTDLMPNTMWPQAILPTSPISGVNDVERDFRFSGLSTTFSGITEKNTGETINLTELTKITDPISGEVEYPITTIEEAKRYFSNINLKNIKITGTDTATQNGERIGNISQADTTPDESIISITNFGTAPYDNFNFTGKTAAHSTPLSPGTITRDENGLKIANSNQPFAYKNYSWEDNVTTPFPGVVNNTSQLVKQSSVFANENDTGLKTNPSGNTGTLRLAKIVFTPNENLQVYNRAGVLPVAYVDLHFHFTTNPVDGINYVFLNTELAIVPVDTGNDYQYPQLWTWTNFQSLKAVPADNKETSNLTITRITRPDRDTNFIMLENYKETGTQFDINVYQEKRGESTGSGIPGLQQLYYIHTYRGGGVWSWEATPANRGVITELGRIEFSAKYTLDLDFTLQMLANKR